MFLHVDVGELMDLYMHLVCGAVMCGMNGVVVLLVEVDQKWFGLSSN